LDIDVNRIMKEDGVGQIRAGVKWLAVGNCMQRIQRYETGARSLTRPIDQGFQIASIAAAPIPARSDRIEADGQACRAARFQPSRLVRPVGTDYQARRRRAFASNLDRNFVVAQRKVISKPNPLTHELLSVEARRFRRWNLIEFDLSAPGAA